MRIDTRARRETRPLAAEGGVTAAPTYDPQSTVRGAVLAAAASAAASPAYGLKVYVRDRPPGIVK